MTRYDTSEFDNLVERTVKLYNSKPKDQRLIIGITGIPGSGKTTLSTRLCQELNRQNYSAVNLPQDGYHLYRYELQQMPNSEEAVRRRGAPFTFNAPKFLDLVKQLHDKSVDLYAPSFDHSKKDPVELDIKINKSVEIVILEGNYLGLKDPIWVELNQYIDEIWMLDTPFELARSRLIRRHLESGIVSNEDEARNRADENDLVNGQYILDNSIEPHVTIVTRLK